MSILPRQLGWLVLPVAREELPGDLEENRGWRSCLYCQESFYHEHQCLKLPPPTEPSLAVLEALYEGRGWRSCLCCRAVHRSKHKCSKIRPAPKPAKKAKPKPITSCDDDTGAHFATPGYGYRLGKGFWMRFGSHDDWEVYGSRCRHASDLHHSESNSAAHETGAEAGYWRQWRRRNIFIAKAPGIARTAFQLTVKKGGIEPYVPGNNYPDGHRRYRVMGATEWYGNEIVIDLGLWVGSEYGTVHLEYACAAATQAIQQRWKQEVPFVKAGFAWGEITV
jgi:hypothetical protein